MSSLSDLEKLVQNLKRVAEDPDLKQKREDDFLVRQERIKKQIEDRDKKKQSATNTIPIEEAPVKLNKNGKAVDLV